MTGADTLRYLGEHVVQQRLLGHRDDLRTVQAVLASGRKIVVKTGSERHDLVGEARMLFRLRAAGMPVPDILERSPTCLILAYVSHSGGLCAASQADLADLIALLHAGIQPFFGYEETTRLAGLVQPNPPSDLWIPFFAEHRLRHMALLAHRHGALPADTVHRVERLAGRIERWLTEPTHPSLIHGDLWNGNILVDGGRIAALIDPALAYAHPEQDLAFGTLFGTLGRAFFDRYQAHLPLEPGFFEERRDLYNLYPLLVHVRLFGAPYLADVHRTLSRYGV